MISEMSEHIDQLRQMTTAQLLTCLDFLSQP
jgi:hypothetical protein